MVIYNGFFNEGLVSLRVQRDAWRCCLNSVECFSILVASIGDLHIHRRIFPCMIGDLVCVLITLLLLV